MEEAETDYMLPDAHRDTGDLDVMVDNFYFMQTRRNTWVCMTCFSNVDQAFRKQHAFFHAWHRHVQLNNSHKIRPDHFDALEKKKLLFCVSVAYCNGEYWIQKVESL